MLDSEVATTDDVVSNVVLVRDTDTGGVVTVSKDVLAPKVDIALVVVCSEVLVDSDVATTEVLGDSNVVLACDADTAGLVTFSEAVLDSDVDMALVGVC